VIAEEEALWKYVQTLSAVPKAEVSHWGDFRRIVKSLDPGVDIEIVGRYSVHGIYRVQRRTVAGVKGVIERLLRRIGVGYGVASASA
jgi:hypothetical protein